MTVHREDPASRKVRIRNWFTGYRIGEWPGRTLAEAVESAVRLGADLSWADLRGARLEDANLTGARLSFANLRGARLAGARLWSARLSFTNLAAADLRQAELVGADLRGAVLRGASLKDADLAGADLSGIQVMGAGLQGRRWLSYLTETVPRLLTAAGRTLKQIVLAGAWERRDWNLGPVSEAFGVPSFDEVPEAWREEAVIFTRLFDAGLVPCPDVEGVRGTGALPRGVRRSGRGARPSRRARAARRGAARGREDVQSQG